MTRDGVRRFVAAYFLVLFGAVILRIDYFPLSWVPMYGFREEKDLLTVVVGNLDERGRGFAATRADGERLTLSRHDLNIPPANFRRLYQERAFGEGPPQHPRERAELMAFNRWWYETLIGPDPMLTVDYQRDLLRSVNRTFGLADDDPRRIVQLEVSAEFATFTRAQLDSGRLDHPVRERRTAIITAQGTRYVRGPVDG
jgi:hypothetical protein